MFPQRLKNNGLSTNIESRLHFIDVARSLAIILMLQGHFISSSFADYTTMTAELRSSGTSGNFAFDIWCQLRAFTAPLFFTITGLVFSYLLIKNQSGNFWQQKRVRKGIKRGVLILFWGYFLQTSVTHIQYYSKGIIPNRFFSFHVLHCIGLGLLAIVLVYWIYSTVKRIPFEVLLIICGTLVFLIAPMVRFKDLAYFPENAPLIIQNAFFGPNSVFPIFPWFGFIFFGGAIGVLVHKYQHKINKKYFSLKMVLIGITICISANYLTIAIGSLFSFNPYHERGFWWFRQLAIIICLLGLVMFVQRKTKVKMPFLIAIGQNTLVVYILHVILLYGAVIGVGLKTYIGKSLTFGESTIGAILFIILFGFITKFQPFAVNAIRRIFIPSKKEKNEVPS